jgi:hypothetical protein
MAEATDSVHLAQLRTRLHCAAITIALQRAMNLTKHKLRAQGYKVNHFPHRELKVRAEQYLAQHTLSEFPEMEYKPIADGEGLQVPPDIELLEFLMAIYRDHRQPMSRRMRAAIEAAQYRHPKLGAIATTNMNGQDFASLLERAILRSGKARELKLIEHRQVEGERLGD